MSQTYTQVSGASKERQILDDFVKRSSLVAARHRTLACVGAHSLPASVSATACKSLPNRELPDPTHFPAVVHLAILTLERNMPFHGRRVHVCPGARVENTLPPLGPGDFAGFYAAAGCFSTATAELNDALSADRRNVPAESILQEREVLLE